MNSTPTSKAIEPQDALIARADERLAHAYQQIARADEELTRVSEQVAKMEREAAQPRSAEPAPQPPPSAGPAPQPAPSTGLAQQSRPRRSALRALIGLALAAGIVVAALVLQSSHGGAARLVVARWAQQLVSTPLLPPENPHLPAQPAPSTVRVAAAEAVPPQATPPAQTAPQNAAPTATAALPDQTQLLQAMARNLANLERDIEQLKANQQQMAGDNSKAIEALKASQEEMKRVLARVSEQNPPRTSSPPTRPMPSLRKPERTPQVRARPRLPREWIYDDYW
jgi:hypothetical protein